MFPPPLLRARSLPLPDKGHTQTQEPFLLPTLQVPPGPREEEGKQEEEDQDLVRIGAEVKDPEMDPMHDGGLPPVIPQILRAQSSPPLGASAETSFPTATDHGSFPSVTDGTTPGHGEDAETSSIDL